MPDENFFDVVYSIETEREAKAIYDRWAEVYDRDVTGNDYQQPLRCAQALAQMINIGSAKILDIGCGTGLAGLAIKVLGFSKIDGCDLSTGMLKKAADLGVYDRLFETNLNEPPIDSDDDTYDAITAVGVFSFGHVDPIAVSEFLRVSKSGAPIIIGLNDHFYDEGSLTAKLDELETENLIKIVSQEHGEHLPGNDLKGWVISLINTKNQA